MREACGQRRQFRGSSTYHRFLWIVLFCFYGGCDGTSERTPATDYRAAEAESSPESPPGVTEENTVEAEPRRSVSSHPIDQLPEGKAFRTALDALDNGDQKSAEQIRQRLADHPQYGVLADAIRANQLAVAGEFEQALALGQEISRVPVMRAEAYVVGGNVFRQQGRLTDAIGAYRAALQDHPENVRAHRWLGVVYHDTGAMRLAAEHLREVARLDPDDYRALRLAGRIHYDYQTFEEAVSDFERALQRDPDAESERQIRIELADSLRELRRVDEALDVLAPCEATPRVLIARAECHEALGEQEQAAELATQALAKSQDNADAHFVLGRVQLAEGSIESAIEHLRAAVEAKPSDHEPRFLLGRALLRKGDTEAGREQLAESERLKVIFLEMAELHHEAIQKPSDAAVRVELGQHAEALGRPAIARSWYAAAVGMDPENETAREALRRLRTSAANP